MEHPTARPAWQDDRAAEVNAYLVLTSLEAGQPRLVTTGFYRFELEKSATGWAISHVFAGFDSPF